MRPNGSPYNCSTLEEIAAFLCWTIEEEANHFMDDPRTIRSIREHIAKLPEPKRLAQLLRYHERLNTMSLSEAAKRLRQPLWKVRFRVLSGRLFGGLSLSGRQLRVARWCVDQRVPDAAFMALIADGVAAPPEARPSDEPGPATAHDGA